MLAMTSSAAFGAELVGRIVELANGETITVLVNSHESVKVRLTGIDAPEKPRPFESAAKKHLSNKVFSRTVTIEWTKRDRYLQRFSRLVLPSEVARPLSYSEIPFELAARRK